MVLDRQVLDRRRKEKLKHLSYLPHTTTQSDERARNAGRLVVSIPAHPCLITRNDASSTLLHSHHLHLCAGRILDTVPLKATE